MAWTEQRMREERLRAFRLRDQENAKKGIKRRRPVSATVGKQTKNGYSVTHYERMGGRYVQLGNTENWATRDDARENYGVRISRAIPQPQGGTGSNSTH